MQENHFEQTKTWNTAKGAAAKQTSPCENLHQLEEKYNTTNFPSNVDGSTGSPDFVSSEDKKHDEDAFLSPSPSSSDFGFLLASTLSSSVVEVASFFSSEEAVSGTFLFSVAVSVIVLVLLDRSTRSPK